MARETTLGSAAAGVSVMDTESGVIDVTRLRVAIARLSRRLRRHELAGLTPTQLAALATVERSGPLRLGDLAAAEPRVVSRAMHEDYALRRGPRSLCRFRGSRGRRRARAGEAAGSK